MEVALSPALAIGLEWTSVAGNILFTYLIGREVRAGWLFGFVASMIGVVLYAGAQAWLMGALNGFYAAMGLYGWWTWGRVEVAERIRTMGSGEHALAIVVGGVATAVLFGAMKAMDLEGEHLWMEAFITAFALIATWLMSRKVLENWIYWTVGDIVAVFYNHLIGFNGYVLLMVVYIVLAVVGFLRWRRQMQRPAQG
ncbi:MAG: nicotinamide mononucleotide transporter [Flavobacteriales bacterium]|nr:nicotinamide mononucleotide transporter [Flavobacteriales bacterium]